MLKPTKRELRINHLEEVRDKEEAKKSNLQRKTKIRTLQFEWSDGREVGCNDVEVLEGLEPHPNIEGITIENYLGEKFPPWLLMMKIPSDGDSSRVFDNLVELMLRNCKWCEQLPMLGHLPRLKALWISGMDKIRSIGNEFYGIGDGSTSNGVRPFPALKVLGFRSMKSLLEWKAAPVDERANCAKGSGSEWSKISHLPYIIYRDWVEESLVIGGKVGFIVATLNLC
ncbi:hypothetical protein GH714_037557 [Hevea brasiliensis]|uniref:R13L1/DRL21-like LRR repeat region domain-containing protein n=1 Tax=Hevea brasiliensis TaxID=3981 RepID=A0A6A6L4U0_HEVBR|nr:hypothetical protein GH714_037557 [Hevea brasiliensis]